ncbi:MAG: glutamate racemase [Pseudomonadota bacterium]
MKKNPLGIFDSGVGGLCVLKEIRKQLPKESIQYFADSNNCPYGSKAEDEALLLAKKNIEFLIAQGCKLIVIACNTVTAVAIDNFRLEYNIPFVGMEPAIKPASFHTKSKKIGILATENTFKGKLFKQTYEKYANGIQVVVQPGYGLVELVEKGDLHSEKVRTLLKQYLEPMLEMGVDTLVLGCTHYPFLLHMIHEIAGDRLTIIDPAAAVAGQTRRILDGLGLMSDGDQEPEFQFYTTGETTITQQFISKTMDMPYGLERVCIA